MNVISSTFWGEGPTDDRFLPKIIQRSLEALLLACARGEWDVLEPCILKSRKSGFTEQLIDIAGQSAGFTLVFVHTDADARSEDQKAIPNKINPALEQIARLPDDDVCKNIIAIIPVTKLENWQLADLDALQEVFGVRLNIADLDLQIGHKQLEQKANSKEMLSKAVQSAVEIRGRRRNKFTLEDIGESLAKRISLQKIAQFDSYQRFLGRLKTTLISQNIIRDDCEEDLK